MSQRASGRVSPAGPLSPLPSDASARGAAADRERQHGLVHAAVESAEQAAKAKAEAEAEAASLGCAVRALGAQRGVRPSGDPKQATNKPSTQRRRMIILQPPGWVVAAWFRSHGAGSAAAVRRKEFRRRHAVRRGTADGARAAVVYRRVPRLSRGVPKCSMRHASPLPHLRRDWGSPLPHLRRDWGSPLPHLHRDWGSPLPHLRRDWGLTQTLARGAVGGDGGVRQ
jgi:hypothetical protein